MIHDASCLQLNFRVAEFRRALRVLRELNAGECASADLKPAGSRIIYGSQFDWSQFEVSQETDDDYEIS